MDEQAKLIDISVLLKPGMITWPGDPAFGLEDVLSTSNGDACNVSRISMGSHTGTHVDAPFHYFKDGLTIEKLSLEVLVGETLVVDLSNLSDSNYSGNNPENHKISSYEISANDLEQIDLSGVSRLLFKTANSNFYATGNFSNRYTYLTADAAKYLVDRGISLIGIDYLSVDKPDCNDAHVILLGAGAVILEAIDLSGVEAGKYELICLPLKIHSSDGAPARALLRSLDS